MLASPVIARPVVVAAEPVAFRKVKFWSVEDPVINRLSADAVPESVALVPVIVGEYIVVEVALVVVLFNAVKFWRVVDEVTRRELESVITPEVSIESAAMVDVAKVAGEAVAR